MRAAALALVLALPLAGADVLDPTADGSGSPVAPAVAVRTTWRGEDADALAERILADPDWRAAADARGAFAFDLAVVGAERASFRYDGEIRRGSGPADATIALSASAALVVLNADDPSRALRCLFDAGAIVVAPRSAPERVAVRAYRSQVESDCAPPTGSQRIGAGVFLLDGVVYDAFGSPLGWQDGAASARLGRPTAGVSRLEPAALPRPDRVLDMGDPWLAPLAIAPLLRSAMDCPCEARASLVPAGDWRAALEADPRAEADP